MDCLLLPNPINYKKEKSNLFQTFFLTLRHFENHEILDPSLDCSHFWYIYFFILFHWTINSSFIHSNFWLIFCFCFEM